MSPNKDFPFGPYHRVESPTQSNDVARLQESGGELWGRYTRFSGGRAVKAIMGPLQTGEYGIEFYTKIKPPPSPNYVYWDETLLGVRLDGDFAVIDILVVKNTQTRP